MEPKNEIQKIEQASPNEMIKLAIEGNADLEKLEKLLDLQERYERNEARKAFSSDFSAVQANIAAVVKTKINPQTHSKYAGLDSVLESSKPVYTEQGFSIIFYEGKTDVAENVRVCADVLHKAGHKETYHLDVPLGGVGIKGVVNMTKIHAKATSVTYGRRYLLCMIWNIPTQDDDGAGVDEKPPTLPELTSQNRKILDTICAKLKEMLPTNKDVDRDRVAATFLVHYGTYPSKMNKVDEAVNWIIGLKQAKTWTKENGAVENTSSRPPTAESDVAGTEAGGKGSADDNTLGAMTEGCYEQLREVLSAAFKQISIPQETIVFLFCKLCAIVLGGDEMDYTVPGSLTVNKLALVKERIETGIPQEILDAFEPDDTPATAEELEEHCIEKLETYFRYKCNNCGHVCNKLASNDNCPKCLKTDIADYGPEDKKESEE